MKVNSEFAQKHKITKENLIIIKQKIKAGQKLIEIENQYQEF